MHDVGYSKRGRNVNEAQAEVHAAFKEVVNRNDRSDAKTRRWLNAIKAFRATYARVYPDPLRQNNLMIPMWDGARTGFWRRWKANGSISEKRRGVARRCDKHFRVEHRRIP